MVIDPDTHVPDIDVRHPLAGDVYLPNLSAIKLAAVSTIEYSDLFWVSNLRFEVNGQTINAHRFDNGHYTGWWTPPGYGSYSVSVISTSNFGASRSELVNITVVESSGNMQVVAAEEVWINPSNVSQVVEAELPSFLGAFDQVQATLEVTCPPGGCGEWDRLASIDAQNHEGEWIEIIRYITPYGVPCSHSIDLTDYISLLSGKINFRFNCETLDNGYYYMLTLDYNEGTPEYPYSSIYKIWQDNYPFGDYANLQPVENQTFEFPDNTSAATLKVVSTGHGWGNLNTGNAAEFYEATHHIWVNGAQAFEQHNWSTCNPNPDACQPQNGTWFYNRAGWCPGSIAPWFDFNLNAYVSGGAINLGYVFDEDYVDLCHPNHPDCVTGVTCTDCDDGYNPQIEVACNVVCFSAIPIVGISNPVGIPGFVVNPNPSQGIVHLSSDGSAELQNADIRLMNSAGILVKQISWKGQHLALDLSSLPKGVYMLMLETPSQQEIRKLILQ
jgi:hypothetical protein